MGLLTEALVKREKQQPKKEDAPKPRSSMKEVLREAWEASKADDFDKFATAFESAIKISKYKE